MGGRLLLYVWLTFQPERHFLVEAMFKIHPAAYSCGCNRSSIWRFGVCGEE